ncbi:acyltransferase family protein [Roseateles paludis]|uniref:Acyltransferase n=1 Tax=Roseateles paludis TaxID=3145238 RepID=A0ABV0G013_9BURK
MGSLRLLLALAVVVLHCGVHRVLTGGALSVQIFYMISGFLITHVLLSKPVYQSYGTFLKSRWVRIYPIYAVVALASWLSIHVLTSTGMPGWDALPLQAKLMLVLANLFILGQDWVMFFTADERGLVFTSNFWQSSPKLYTFLLVQQAWSLGVELSFYLIAPFIVRRKLWVLGLLVASLGLRVVLLKLVVGWSDPWTYRFFPTELALFLLGSAAWHWLLPLWRRLSERRGKVALAMATAVLLVACAGFGSVVWPDWTKGPLLIALATLTLPAAFLFSSGHAWDRELGELSYPLYLCHTLVIFWASRNLPEGWVHQPAGPCLRAGGEFGPGCHAAPLGPAAHRSLPSKAQA